MKCYEKNICGEKYKVFNLNELQEEDCLELLDYIGYRNCRSLIYKPEIYNMPKASKLQPITLSIMENLSYKFKEHKILIEN